MTVFADLYRLAEDERIRMIGEQAEHGSIVAFMVDDDESKIVRYVSKLTTRYKVKIIERIPGPVPNVVTIKVGPIPN